MTVINKTLSNGVRLILAPDTRFKTASAALHLPGGAKNEQLATAGITHLLEHLLFKRTKKYSSKELGYKIDALGGELNGYTDFDTLCLHGITATSDLPELLELLVELVYQADFNSNDLELELGIIKQEIKESEDDFVDQAYRFQSCNLFPNSRRSLPVFGDALTNSAITYQELIELRDQIATNPILTISGGFDPLMVEQLCLEIFPTTNNSKITTDNFTCTFGEITLVDRSSNQVYLVLTMPWIDLTASEFVGGLVLTTILGGSASSRLFVRLREELGLSYEIGCEVEIVSGVLAHLNIFAVLDRAKLSIGIENIINELVALKEIEPAEFKKAVQMIKNQITIDLDDPFSKVKPYLDAILQNREPLFAEELIEKLNSLKIEDLPPIYERYFLKQKFSATILGKKIKEKELKSLRDFAKH